MDSHVPLRRRMSPQSKNIFMTSHCLKIKKQKKNLWNKYRKSGLDSDLDAYKSCRNKLRSERRRLRGDFEGQIISNIKTKTKTFWKYVNARLKSRVDIPSIILPDGSNAYSPEAKAEALNKYFSSIFTEEDNTSVPTIDTNFTGAPPNVMKFPPETIKMKILNLTATKHRDQIYYILSS